MVAAALTVGTSSPAVAAAPPTVSRAAAPLSIDVAGATSVGASRQPAPVSHSAVPLGASVTLPNPVFGINNCDGRREEFTRGSDNALWHRWEKRPSDTSSWSGWVSLGGAIIYNPSAARNSDCRLDVFVIGIYHEMFHKWQDSAASGGWSGWEDLGGNLVSSPWNGYFSDGRIWVGAWGPDGIEHFKRQTAPSQGPWIGWY